MHEGEQTVTAHRISKPLDFTAVTDHAEYFGELKLCTRDSSTLAYWLPQCMLNRADNFFVRLLAARYWSGLSAAGRESDEDRSIICSLPGVDCQAMAAQKHGPICSRQPRSTMIVAQPVSSPRLWPTSTPTPPSSIICIAT